MSDLLPYCLIPALVFAACAWYVNRYAHRRTNEALKMYRTKESRMGQHIGGARVTVHSLINRLAGKPAKPRQGNLLAPEELSDVSFWQGVIDWAKMRTKARKVIIRAGQNLWEDIKFYSNYSAAKVQGFQRGIYWFYDGRVSPGAQAVVLVRLIKDDRPELPVFIDWERNFGGSHEGLKNVVAMMQEVERLLPGVTVGLYTGFYYFSENSNPIMHKAQYAYLAARPLWLAFYAPLSDVRIPKPWLKMKYWQWGTPPVGLDWGVQSKELDMNQDLDGDPDSTPIPPIDESEESMQYRFIVVTNERTDPTVASNLTGKVYQIGEVVSAVVLPPVSAMEQWMRFDGGTYAAYRYGGTLRVVTVDPEPETPAEIKVSLDQTVRASIGGVVYVANIVVSDVVMVRE